jgi:hypothetical protein
MSTSRSKLRDPRLIGVVLVLLCTVVIVNVLTFRPRQARHLQSVPLTAGSLYLPADLETVARRIGRGGSTEPPAARPSTNDSSAGQLTAALPTRHTARPEARAELLVESSPLLAENWRDPFERVAVTTDDEDSGQDNGDDSGEQ